jgi:hypothetical protein
LQVKGGSFGDLPVTRELSDLLDQTPLSRGFCGSRYSTPMHA